MTDRADQIADFLAENGWAGARHMTLAGDASARRYERLALPDRRAVLMDADPAWGEDTERFARVQGWLAAQGYSVPAIVAADHRHGFLLLEDFGDGQVAHLLAKDPAPEATIYEIATDLLADLVTHPVPGFVQPLDGPALADLTVLTTEWYPRACGEAPNAAVAALPELVAHLHARLDDGRVGFSLRDFHAENMMWLPAREGLARIGLLDFQDAVATHPAYDLVSLLQDARRDVPMRIEDEMIRRHARATGVEETGFRSIYALLGAQRAVRILGIFARLTVRDGRTSYLRFVPRVWGALQRNLAHPALSELAAAVAAGLPEPTPEILRRMEARSCSPVR